MQIPSRYTAIMAASLAVATLCPQQAFALSIPADFCSEAAMAPVAPVIRLEPTQSRLELMRLQQAGLLRAAAADVTQVALPVTRSHCQPDPPVTPILAPDFVDEQVEQPFPAADKPDVFGSIALPIAHTPLDVKWRSASRSPLAKRSGPWASLLRSTSGQGRAEQIQAVNQWVNARVSFIDDRRDKRGADRWSGASETLRRRRGDCEDYAIAKMKLLEAVGIQRSDMYLVVVDDLVRRADHALLVVRLGQQMLVLDNGTDQMLDARQVADYRPVFSYGAAGAWIHGYAENPEKIAAI